MKPAKKGRVLVPKTRNAGTMTEAAFRSWIRSQLRRMSMRWKPIYTKFTENRRLATADDRIAWGNRITYTHQCERCQRWYPKESNKVKQLEVDHIIPCGSLIDIEKDAGPFILRMLVETSGLRLLCLECHHIITQEAANDQADR